MLSTIKHNAHSRDLTKQLAVCSQPGLMTFLDRLYDRKFSGLSLLATGAIGIGLGWAVTAFLASYHVPVVPAHDDCTSEQQNESEMDLVSEPETPRDFGDGPRHQPPRRTVTPLSFNNAHAQADYKQVIIIRTDLDMVCTV